MAYSDLTGRQVRLKLVGPSGVAQLHERFEKPAVWEAAGCDEEPSLERLKKKLFEYRSLVVWELHPAGAKRQAGYIGIVSYSGPPYVWVDVFEGPPPIEAIREATTLLVPAFFHAGGADRLFVHLPREHEDVGREPLLEAGFTPADEVPFQDPAAVASFVIDRNAFEVYYEEGGDAGEES